MYQPRKRKIDDGRKNKQDEISATRFVIEIQRKKRDEYKLWSMRFAQADIYREKSCEKEEEQATVEN